MQTRSLISAMAMTAVLCASLVLGAQDEKWNTTPQMNAPSDSRNRAPAPRRDLSGIWAALGGVGAKGAHDWPDDPAHVGRDVPYTPLGLAARLKNKPGEGEQQYPAAEANDPANACDPEGFPRSELYEFRIVELRQTEKSLIIINQFGNNWRKIWTDGKELPKNSEPRWNGYSVGHWDDDYTFIIDTVNMDVRSWLDNVGRPHSDALRVEERFHRVDYDNMELTVSIDDPKFYAQSWRPLNRLPMRLLPADFDMKEIICSPSEVAAYNKQISAGHTQDDIPRNHAK